MATKYVSSLTGPEMDAALIDMAYHNSEAYAVGTRNGVAVGSGDVTYHNNAKYYAEQAGTDAQAAEAAAARAEAAVPSGTAGAVFFDRAQSLTTAQQAQARANIMAGGSNDNLLDNAYFVGGGSQLGDGVFPINQRGQTQYTAAGFVFDRWFKSGGVTVTLDTGGLTIANSNGWPDGINQRFPMHFFAQMNGEAITASVLYADGSVDSGTAIIDATQNYQWLKYPDAGEIGFQLKNFQDGAAYDYFDYISFGAGANSTPKKIKKFKLEKGSVSTLANDPVPDFGEERRKCQQYLWIKTFSGNTQLGSGIALTADQAVVSVVTPVSMRPAQNITFTANCLLVGNGQVATVSAVTGINQYDNIARITLSSSGLTPYHTYSFFTTTETTMAIYAEL